MAIGAKPDDVGWAVGVPSAAGVLYPSGGLSI